MIIDYRALISGYEGLKRQVEAAIKDEQDAQKMYGDISNKAMNVSMRSQADQIRSIRDEEIRHEKTFRTIMTSIDAAIGAAKKEEAEKKRQEELKKSQVKDPNRRYGR